MLTSRRCFGARSTLAIAIGLTLLAGFSAPAHARVTIRVGAASARKFPSALAWRAFGHTFRAFLREAKEDRLGAGTHYRAAAKLHLQDGRPDRAAKSLKLLAFVYDREARVAEVQQRPEDVRRYRGLEQKTREWRNDVLTGELPFAEGERMPRERAVPPAPSRK
jgi:hypothetical protein